MPDLVNGLGGAKGFGEGSVAPNDDGSSAPINITSIFGSFDPMIPSGSELPEGRNIRLDVAGHFRILGATATIETVLREIAQPERSYPTIPPRSRPSR